MKALLSICLLWVSFSLFSQNNILSEAVFSSEENIQEATIDVLFLCRESIDRATNNEKLVFLEDDWKDAILLDFQNKAYRLKSRYQVMNDEMQIQYDESTKALFPQKIKAIKVGQMVFVPIAFEQEGYETYGYFEVLSDGKKMLLKRYEHINGKIMEQLYVKTENKPAERLKCNRSSVLKALESAKKQVQQFASQKGLS